MPRESERREYSSILRIPCGLKYSSESPYRFVEVTFFHSRGRLHGHIQDLMKFAPFRESDPRMYSKVYFGSSKDLASHPTFSPIPRNGFPESNRRVQWSWTCKNPSPDEDPAWKIFSPERLSARLSAVFLKQYLYSPDSCGVTRASH